MRIRLLSWSIPLPILVFIFARVPFLLAATFDGLRGYGDFIHFFNLAALPGLPFIHYWSEFPPVFPFLSSALYALAGGKEHVYTYLLVMILFAADLGSLNLLIKLEEFLFPQPSSWRSMLYAAVLAGLAYSWWYFDSLAVFFTLLALYLAFSKHPAPLAGIALGLGILTKLFPILILPALWRKLTPARSAAITLTAFALSAAVYAGLWTASPAFTSASLRSQAAKGSWETVWALLDGNLHTGNFGPESERLDPISASLARGNPARISPWASLLGFGALGLALFWKAPLTHDDPLAALHFTGLTWVIFYLWSPGWSPQWALYLLPLILLTLPERLAPLLAALIVIVNLLEWPLLLSRGMFSSLPLPILLRTALLVLLGLTWWQELSKKKVQL